MNNAVKRFTSVSLVLSLVTGLLPMPPFGGVVRAVGIFPDAPFCIPTTGYVAQLYSAGHQAIDIGEGSGKGNPVYAPYSGEIIYVGRGFAWEGNYPDIYPKHTVVINHGKISGKYVASMIAHMGANGDPSKGIKPVSYITQSILDGTLKAVLMGTLIGYQGTAGVATGTHIHFAVRVKTSATPFTAQNVWTSGSWTDPKSYIVGSDSLSKWDYLETNCNFYLIRKQGTATVYFIEKGKKRAIPDRDTFLALGFEWEDVHDLSAGAFNSIPTGSTIPSVNSSWVAAYFTNRALAMPPKLIRAEAAIDMRWGSGAPSGIPKDDFSARFVRFANFPVTGTYRFHIEKDDGGRLWIDGTKIFDKWCHTSACVGHFTVDYNINAGTYLVRFDYYERGGSATARLWWDTPDKTGPQVSASFGVEAQGGGWFTGDVPVTIIASDPSGIAEIAYQVGPPRDPDGWTRIYNQSSASLVVSGEGIHELYFNAKDKNGNWGTPEGFEVIPIDFTPPTTAFSYVGPSYQDGEGKLFVSPETQFILEADDTNPTDPLVETSSVAETKYQYHTTLYDSEEQEYEEPFSFDGEDGLYTINYHSTDVAGNIEPKSSQEVHLDSTPPVSLDNSDGAWHNEDVVVTVTSDDGEGSGVQKIVYQKVENSETKDGEVFNDQEAAVTFEDEGIHELFYLAVDNVENIEEEKHVTLIKIDKTPPEITGAPTASPNENGWYNEDVIVHFVAEDQPDLSGLKSVTPDVVVSAEGEDQEVTGTAEDNAGNTASTTVGPINIDKTDPTSEITFPEEGEYYNAESWEAQGGEVRGIAYDNLSGIESVKVGVEGIEEEEAQLKDYGEVETGWEYPLGLAEDGSDDGQYIIWSRATDLAGNMESTTEVTFVFDNTPPSSTLDPEGSLEPYYNSLPISLTIEAKDNIGLNHVVLYYRSTTGNGEWHYRPSTKPVTDQLDQTVYSFQTLAEGGWEIVSSAVDKAKNREVYEGKTPVKFVYDFTAPITSVSLSGLTGLNGWYVSPVTLQLSADDAKPGIEVSGVSQVFYTVNGLEPQVYSIALTFGDGEYVVEFWSIDRAGNIEKVGEENVLLFKVDTTDPTSKITSLEEGAYYNAETWPGIFGTADDINPIDPTIETSGIFHVEVQVDKDGEEGSWELAWETYNWSLPGFIPADGFYTVYSRATDRAGNQESTSKVSFIYDATPPVTSAELSGAEGLNDWYLSPVTLTLNALDETSGISQIWYRVGDSAPQVYKDSSAFEEDGIYAIDYWAVDRAGNIENPAKRITFRIDQTLPSSQLGELDPYYNNDPLDENPIELGYTYSDNLSGVERARLYKRTPGGDWEYHRGSSREPTLPFNVKTLAEGRWEFASVAVDYAGNIEVLPGEADTWTIYDITPPTSTSTSIEEGTYYNARNWPGIYGMADDTNLADPSIETSGVAQVEIWVDKDGEEGEWMAAEGSDSWSFDFDLEDGFYTVYSRVADRAGNWESTSEVSFTYDATPPVTSVNLQGLTGLNGWYVSPVTLTSNPLDQTSGIKRTDLTVIKDGKEHYHTLQYDSENPFLFKEDGTYVVRFWSEDLARNIEQEQEITFKIDTTPPTVPAGSIPSGAFTEGETLRVGLTAEEGVKIYYSLNGSEPILYSGLITIIDDATLSAYAVDEAGNRSASVEFNYVFNPAPQVLGAQIEDGGEEAEEGSDLSAGRAGVGGEGISTPVGEPNPKGLGVWPIPLVVMLGGVSYLLRRRRGLSRR